MCLVVPGIRGVNIFFNIKFTVLKWFSIWTPWLSLFPKRSLFSKNFSTLENTKTLAFCGQKCSDIVNIIGNDLCPADTGFQEWLLYIYYTYTVTVDCGAFWRFFIGWVLRWWEQSRRGAWLYFVVLSQVPALEVASGGSWVQSLCSCDLDSQALWPLADAPNCTIK